MAARLAAIGTVGIATLAFGLASAQDDPPAAEAPKKLEIKDLPKPLARLFELHNKERAKLELDPLEPDARLMAAAKRHADDMAAKERMDHTGSDDTTMVDRVRDEKYDFRLVGENIAMGPTTPEQANKSWLDSPGHKKNILTPDFKQMGAAFTKSRKSRRLYWCVVFGNPLVLPSDPTKKDDEPARKGDGPDGDKPGTKEPPALPDR